MFTQPAFRNVLYRRSLCCGRVNTIASLQNNLRVRDLHSFRLIAVPKSNLLGGSRLEKSKLSGSMGLFAAHLSSVFITARSESSSPVSSEIHVASTLSGEEVRATASTSQSTESLVGLSGVAEAASPPKEATAAAEPLSTSLGPEAQEALIFESIPEPPAVPVPIEDAAGIIGEPTLASLGLGGWSPSGIVQQCLEFFHVGLGMPWWASIMTGTIIIRLLLFPLVIKSQKNAAKMQNNMPQLQLLQVKMTEARQTGNALLAAKYGQDMMVFMKEKDISPFKSMMVPLAMAPVFISCFFGIRKMANLPVESLKDGGLFWFTDLTVCDPYYILPLITSLTVWITLEVGADGMKMNASTHGPLLKYFFRAMPVIMFPFTIHFPGAILCYWVSTNAISLIQVSILKIPAVRTKLGIPQVRKINPESLAIKPKGFRKDFKEAWTNMKISKEIEDRQRNDEINFKRAGRGPLAKTYKYDPTKVNPLQDAAAAMQAKKK